jgi:hypothetical protein
MRVSFRCESNASLVRVRDATISMVSMADPHPPYRGGIPSSHEAALKHHLAPEPRDSQPRDAQTSAPHSPRESDAFLWICLELRSVRKFEASLAGARLPPEYIAAVKAFASQDGVPFAEYVRDTFHDHILVRGAAFRD